MASTLNFAVGGVTAIALASGASYGINEQHQQAQAENARSYIQEYAKTANSMFMSEGAWPNTLSSIKQHMATVPMPDGFAEPKLSVRSDGALVFTVDAKDQKAAVRLAKSEIGNNFSIDGKVVTYSITPPQGSALRGIYKDQIDSSNKLAFSPNKSVDINSHQILGVNDVRTGSVLTNCVMLGSSSVCDGGAGELQISTSLAQISNNLQSSTSISASIVELINGLKANSLTAKDIITDRTTAGDMIVNAANLTNADINLLTAISANMKTYLAQQLTVSGNTKLAGVVGNSASLNKLTGTDFTVSSKAVINALETNQLVADTGKLEVATIAQLIATIGEIDNLTSNLISVNKLIANVGIIDSLQSTTADISSAVITKGTIKSINATTFKGKVADLGAAVIKANLDVDSASLGSVTSDVAAIGELTSDTVNTKSLNGKALNVAISLKTNDLDVTDTATITGNVVVDELTQAKKLAVTSDLSVRNLLTALRLVVNDDVIVGNLLTSKNLNVTGKSTFNKLNVNKSLSTQSATVTTTVNSGAMTVTNGVVIGGVTSVANAVASNSIEVTGKTSAGQITASEAALQTANIGKLDIDGTLTTNSLIGQYQATINKAVVTNLASTNSSLGAISGVSLALSNQVMADVAKFNALDVSGLATFGSIETSSSAIVRGALNVTSDIGAKNLTTGLVTASSADIKIVNANTVTAAGNITTGNALTSSGANLNVLNGIYINHDGRILTLEQFRNECTTNWTYACAGTLPKLVDMSCSGCTQTSYASGSFAATTVSKILDCPAGCNYSWSVGSGLSKTSCPNGSVTAGQTKTVSCLVSASPTVGVDRTLTSTVALSVAHAQRASLAVQNDYSVNWSFIGANPSGIISCPLCQSSQEGSGVFNATALAHVQNCAGGCSYEWTFGPGIKADVCSNGATSSNSITIPCKVSASPSVQSGKTLSSNVSVKVTSTAVSSKFFQKSYPISWEHKESFNLANDAKIMCNGSCSNCQSAPSNCSANDEGRGNRDAYSGVTIAVENACRAGETCSYKWTWQVEDVGWEAPVFKDRNTSLFISLTTSCRSGSWASAYGSFQVVIQNHTLNQTATRSGGWSLNNSCYGYSNDL